MSKLTKNQKLASEKIEEGKSYSIAEASNLLSMLKLATLLVKLMVSILHLLLV